MQATTVAFQQAFAARGVRPVYLVEVLSADQHFLSASMTLGGLYLAGQGGPIAGAGVLAGATRGPYQPLLAGEGRGLSSLSVALDPQSQAVRVGAVTVELLNQGNYARRLYTTAPWDNAIVRVLVGAAGLQYSDFLPLFWGVIDNAEITWDALTLDVIDDALRQHRDLSVPLGAQDFPNAPRSERGRAIPILIGRCTDVEAIPVSSAPQGHLAFALGTSDTTLTLTELDATFPASGTISIGSEVGVTYAGRTTITVYGITYLRLHGLTRSSPATQALRTPVTLTSLSFEYLVGYEVGEVTEVRDHGTLLSTSDYTVTLRDTGADRPVTTITLDSAPTGTITVDADGINVHLEAIENGGFETGSLSPWVQGTGATATVTSGNAQEGTYKLELEGADGAFKDAWLEFPTVVGRWYTLQFAYRDQIDGSNLLTNGSFESGLTGWTARAVDGSPYSYATVVAQLGVEGGSVVDGSKALEIGNSADHIVAQYFHEVSQDVATTVGLQYSLVYVAKNTAWFAKAGIYTYWYTRDGYALGTPSNPALYSSTLHEVSLQHARRWVARGPFTFTAQETTTRVTLRGYGSAVGFPHGLTYPLYIDGAVLLLTDTVPTSTSAYQLGVPGEPDLYASATLPQIYGWDSVEVSFQAIGDTAQITLQSQWTGTAVASLFDGVRLLDSGRNPADAIASVIDEYLPEMRRDVPSFETAYQQLAGWQFGAYLPDPGESKPLLERMAFQCTSRLVTNASGKTRLVVLDPEATPVLTLSTAHILEDSLRIVREPLDTLYSEIIVYYGLRSGESTSSPESYQGVVSATPDATTHPTRALHLACQQARLTLRRDHRWDVFADMIRDRDTAHKLLEHLVERHTRRQDLVTLRTTYRAAAIEVGDLVTVIHPLLQAEDPTVCEVLGVAIHPGNAEVELTLRTLRFGGIYESWDWNNAYVELTVVTESWES